MLERLIVRGFQNHEDTEIELDPQITVLVGPSDRGKSAIIRAIRWLCLNRAPKNFIKFGSKSAKGVLFVDGHRIIRTKSKHNTYSLDGKILKAFNRGVPDPIADVLNVDAVNFQRQFDPPFWISLPSPQLTKELNDIVDLSIIDRSLSNVASLVRNTKSEVEFTKQRLAESRLQRDSLLWVRDCVADFAELVTLENRWKTTQYHADTVETLINDVSKYVASRGTIRERLADITKLVDKGNKALELQNQIDRVESKLADIESVERQLCQTRKELVKVESQLAKQKTCPVCGNQISSQ